MVTAEFALALPAFVVVLVLAVSMLGLVLSQVRCVDAARIGARAASRGDTTAAVTSAALSRAPAGARVQVRGPDPVTVQVAAPLPAWGGWLPERLAPMAEASAPREDAP